MPKYLRSGFLKWPMFWPSVNGSSASLPVSDEFMNTLSGLDIRIEQPTPPGTELLLLVRRYGLTAYDAAYLELAKRKGLALATFDSDLIKAASQENVALLGRES